MWSTYKLILILTCFLLALITGLFYAYSCSVNNGLAKLKDAEYLGAMQSINKAILNPLFFASFMGTLLTLPVCCWVQFRAEGANINFYLFLSASLLYIIGVFGITMFANVPLNNLLDKFLIDSASAKEISNTRMIFEQPWNRFHQVRTLFAAATLLLALTASIVKF